jgi:hypothetical protein
VGVSFIYNDFLKFLHNNKFIPKKIKKIDQIYHYFVKLQIKMVQNYLPEVIHVFVVIIVLKKKLFLVADFELWKQ